MKLFKSIFLTLLMSLVSLIGTLQTSHAGALTDFAENKIVDDVFRTTAWTKPTTVYIGLVLQSAGCSDSAAGTEPAVGAYARVAVTKGDSSWTGTHNSTTGASSGTDGTIDNAAAVTFPTATADWGNLGYFAIYDAATAGNQILCSALTAQRNITTGSTPSFAGSALTIQIDN